MMQTARLFIGDPAATRQAITVQLCAELAQCRGCGACAECARITGSRDWRVMWCADITRGALDDLLSHVSYDAGAVEHRIVLGLVDTYTPAAAARLLKVLEEPPHGYAFLLSAESYESVLATIRSRCHVHWCGEASRESRGSEFARQCVQQNFAHNMVKLMQLCLEKAENKLLDRVPGELDEIRCLLRSMLPVSDPVGGMTQQQKIVTLLADLDRIAQVPQMPGTALLSLRAAIVTLGSSRL